MPNKLTKSNLVEMKSMKNPPEGVKLVFYAVLVLLGYKQQTWRDARLLMSIFLYNYLILKNF